MQDSLSTRLMSSIPDGNFLEELLHPAPQPKYPVVGRWCPLYLEPLIGSSERLCIGIAVATKDEHLVVRTPGIERLKHFYGKRGSDFLIEVVEQTVSSLSRALQNEQARQSLLDEQSPLNFWQPPIEGIECGEVLMGRGRSLEHIARMGLMMSSSLFKELPVEVQSELRLTRPRLEEKVSTILSRSRPDLAGFLKQDYRLSPDARPAVYSFLGENLGSNFDVLDIENLSATVTDIKSRLGDLETLRDLFSEGKIVNTSLFANPQRHYQMFLHLLPIPDGTQKQQDQRSQNMKEALVEVQGFAALRKLPLSLAVDASEIARDVVLLEAA